MSLPLPDCPSSPGDLAGLQVWLDAASLEGSGDGEVWTTWTEAGATLNVYPDGFGPPEALSAGPGATWHPEVLCNFPVLRFTNEHQGFEDELRTSPDERTSDHWIFAETGFTVISLARAVSNDADLPSSGLNFYLFSSRTLAFLMAGNPTDGYVLQFELASSMDGAGYDVPYILGDWVLVVVTWDGATLTTRVNGAEVDTRAFAGPLEMFGESFLQIGLGNPGILSGPLPGTQVAESAGVWVWNRCLTSEELEGLRTGYFPCRYPCLTTAARRRSRVGLLR